MIVFYFVVFYERLMFVLEEGVQGPRRVSLSNVDGRGGCGDRNRVGVCHSLSLCLCAELSESRFGGRGTGFPLWIACGLGRGLGGQVCLAVFDHFSMTSKPAVNWRKGCFWDSQPVGNWRNRCFWGSKPVCLELPRTALRAARMPDRARMPARYASGSV